MVARIGEFLPERINMRVPSMTYSGSFEGAPRGPLYVDMSNRDGTPLVTLSTTEIMATKAVVADGASFVAADFAGGVLPMAVPNRGRYGRTLQVVGSGGGTPVLEITGTDYLGQRLVKRTTLNGATPVTATTGVCLTAWWTIASVKVVSGTAGINLSIGTQNVWGLPYKAVAIVASLMDGLTATAHTLVAPIQTDPQTSSLGDPRGLLTMSTAPNSSHTYGALLVFDDTNLHGVAQNSA